MYKSSIKTYSEVLTVFENDRGEIRCDCDVIYPGKDSAEARKVGTIGHATCTLNLVRCPT